MNQGTKAKMTKAVEELQDKQSEMKAENLATGCRSALILT